MTSNRQIILASTSANRKALLDQTGIKYSIEASDYQEDMTLDLPPQELVKMFSLGKAQSVAKNHEDAIIIGADSIAFFEGKALGKPKVRKEAETILRNLSGQNHQFFTGLTVIDSKNGKTTTEVIENTVTFRKLSDDDIEKYLNSGEPLGGHAAAYAIQGKGSFIVSNITGEYTNVVGLPLYRLATILLNFGINLLAQ